MSVDYLSIDLCAQCKKTLTADFVKCFTCGLKYHYSPCSSLRQAEYSSMSLENKKLWKSTVCKEGTRRSKSPNNLYVAEVHDEQKKKQREEDDDNTDNDKNKRFKGTISVNSVYSNVCNVQTDVSELKSDIKEIKNSIQQLNNSLIQSLAQITDSLKSLTSQVNELKENNIEKETRMQKMEVKVNSLEQQMLNKNIEINNIQNKEIDATEIIKTIASSVDVEINNNDISNAYHIKSKEKVIIEFCSLNKKKELMRKIKRHRINAEVLNNKKLLANNSTIPGGSNNNNDETTKTNNNKEFIYINDHLTAQNRHLLWMAKNKAKECEWKFVWIRNGHVVAKKNENSSTILIANAADIENIA